MARYKVVDRNPRFLPVILDAQLMVGSFEYALRKEFCIHTIGLATLPDAFRIMADVLGIEHKDDEAELVGKVGKQFVIDACGFHADATAFRQALEKGQQCGALVRELAHWKTSLRTSRHDLVLGDIGTDIEFFGLGLHDGSPMIKMKVAGVDTPA
jgi:hypothetical protein